MSPDDALAAPPAGRFPELPEGALPLLAEAVFALRMTGDLGLAWSTASDATRRALDASDMCLLRLDRRSGTLFRFEETGVETPYLAEHGGPVDWVMRHDRPLFEDGDGGARVARETLLWTDPPAALATLPLVAGSTPYGFLLAAFPHARRWSPGERLFLQTLADALALALERQSLQHDLEAAHARVSTLERRLMTARESSAGLLSIVAHESRSPLASIKAYSEALADHLHDARAPREKFLRVVSEESDRLAAIVSDVHELSRIEGGECPLRLTSVPLSRLGADALEGASEALRARDVHARLEVTDDAKAEVDADLAVRVIENLVLNAAQFSPPGGEVVVRLGHDGEEWTCSVTDSGPTLPPGDLTAVFEGFYRTSRRGETGGTSEGTRLGLAISSSIVTLHGGRLWAEQPQDAAGQPAGARFCVSAPLQQVASPRARRIARQTVGRDDLRQLFDAIVEMVAVSLEAGIVSLVLVDPDRGDLFVAASVGHDGGAVTGRRTTLRSGVAGSVAAWGRPLLVENIETDRRFRRLNHPQYWTKSLLCVPLRVEGEVIGVINANNKASGESFDEDDLALLAMLTERVGSAIERATAYPDSRRVVEDALEAVRCMTRLKRDLSLGGRQTVKLARSVSRELGLSPSDVDVVGYVASIHDLGMVKLAQHAMHPHRLSAAQRSEIAAHPQVSIEILRPLEYLGLVRELVLSHHERWDGTGYPRGLQGEAIPLGARILAVVDAWASMTEPRPYRPNRPNGEAVAELRREAGQQFDAVVVDAFLRVLAREGEVARNAA